MRSTRQRMALCALAATVGLAAPAWSAGPRSERARPEQFALLQSSDRDAEEAERHRVAWRAARESLRREEFDQAQRQFDDIIRNQPGSRYVQESYYWRAWALYELGGHDNLRQASESIRTLMQEYPDHSSVDEARELLVRVQGQLMNQHADREAAEAIYAFLESWDEENRGRRDRDPEERCDDMQILAVQSLMQMNPQRALPLLRRVVQDNDKCPELREKAIFVLSQMSHPEAMALILEAARNDPNPEVRQQAVFWLGQVPGDESLQALIDIAHDRTDPEVQAKAVFALSQHRSERAADALEGIARDSGQALDVREKAIFWLGQRHGNVEFLMELYTALEELALREKVLFSISQTGSPQAATWLRGRALDAQEDRTLREKALFWLGQMGELTCDDMKQLYDEFTEREMRQQLIFGLSQMHEPCATRTLIQIIREEKDEELVKKAIFWLGQIGDDEALGFLEELINQ